MIPPNTPPNHALLLPDIRSGWNTGAFFRTADAVGIDEIFLCGHTPYPPHKEISKTALGAEKMVAWSYWEQAEDAIEYLKSKGIKIIGLEIHKKAIPIMEWKQKKQQTPFCLVVGNEVGGIPEKIVSQCDELIFLPMKGKKESLNVAIAGAIAMWEIVK
jgi:23S rRNA (guanosine2251-2'-O)-methyltransferase